MARRPNFIGFCVFVWTVFFGISCTKTENSTASSWTTLSSGVTVDLLAVSFPNENTGYIVGASGTMLKTTDGGSTWSAVTTGVSSAVSITDVYFVNASTGYIVTSAGNAPESVLKTSDGGATWTAQTTNSNQTVYSVICRDANTCAIGGGSGKFETTANGGSAWTAHTSGTSGSISGISYLDATTLVFVSGSGLIRKSTDGGGTWSTIASGTSTDSLNSIYFFDSTTGFIAGGNVNTESPDDPTQIVLKTTDGSATWTDVTPTEDSSGAKSLHAVHAVSADAVFVAGDNSIWKSTDAGTTWETRLSVDATRFYDLAFPSSSIGFAVGGGGSIYKTVNGG